jgi:hypothetical protein
MDHFPWRTVSHNQRVTHLTQPIPEAMFGSRGDLFDLGAARRSLPAVRGVGPPWRSGDHVLSSSD